MAPKKNRRSTLGLGNLLDVLSQGRDSRADADEPLRICVLVGLDAPRYLALAVRDALVPKTPTATVDVWPLGVRLDAVGELPDACLVVFGRATGDVAAAVRHMAESGVPTCMVVPSALDAPEVDLGADAAALAGVVAASDASALPQKLASWLSRSLAQKDVALAAAFPFCRQEVVDGLALRCALENAALGAVSLIPGSDFPLMTTNQAKLAVQMSSCYGAPMTVRRAAELAGVVGAGACYRSLARGAAGLLPGVGSLLRAGIAFAGTMATARGVRASLEGWAPAAALGASGSSGEKPFSPEVAPAAPLPAAPAAPEEAPIEYLEIDPDGKARP